MLSDRDYMRGEDRGYLRSPVNLLLIVLGALFLLECVLRVYGGYTLAKDFGLSYDAIRAHQYWRLLTYQFLHDAPWPLHILFNGIALWFLGRAVLETVGAARFWQVYLGAGLVGGLFEIACQAWHPAYGRALTVGASASVLGLAGAFCFMHPAREIVFFIYVIPVRMRSMTMFWILFGFSVFGTVFPFGGVAHAAHLGGLLAGVAYVRWFLDHERLGWLRRFTPRRVSRRGDVPVPAAKGSGGGRSLRSAAGGEGDSADEFIRREVDPILDKISAHGIQSLTERERLILQKARERMRQS